MPIISTSARSSSSWSSEIPNRRAISDLVAPGCATIHGTSARIRWISGPATARGLTSGCRHGETVEPGDDVGAHLGRGENLRVLEEAEQERAKRRAVRHDELDRRDVVAVVDD